jgi:hypothetical protein
MNMKNKLYFMVVAAMMTSPCFADSLDAWQSALGQWNKQCQSDTENCRSTEMSLSQSTTSPSEWISHGLSFLTQSSKNIGKKDTADAEDEIRRVYSPESIGKISKVALVN